MILLLNLASKFASNYTCKYQYRYAYANSNGYSDIPDGISNIQGELEGIGSNIFGNNMYPFHNQ